MKYKALLFDLDDTILSFSKAEDYAIGKIFDKYDISNTIENKITYSNINLKYWKMYERKEISRENLLNKRFREFFSVINKDISEDELININDVYFSYLTSVVFILPGALELLKELKQDYRLFIITNGVKSVQEKRLSLAPEIKSQFEKIFISEDIGFVKPQIEFINYVLKETKLNKEDILIIGDSLSSDMMLGINSDIDTCWLNNNNVKTDLNINYQIKNINELRTILK